MQVPQAQPVRDRRLLAGSRRFRVDAGPAMIICGTRAGLRRWSEGASRHPEHFLLAPTDIDPGSVAWPVEGAKGICVVTAGASDEYVLRLTQALLADGAEMVVQLRDPHRASIHYRRTE